jgi:gliding motility-associated-like protein
MKKLFFLSLLIGIASRSGAQLCTGSLGDPVVHISFGSGPNPGPSLAAATTNYGYISGDCPGDGFYNVRNSSNGCFNSTWHTVPEDHTPGDVNGYFMQVNASFNPGDFYVDTVRGLCPNTTYEFAAWILNVLKTTACNGVGIDPNLTFKIETTTGTTLASYSTGSIPEDFTPTWRQYGLFFQTPAGITTVVLRITNDAPGGCGNDLLLDDITFRPCGPNVTAALSITGTSTTVCVGNNTAFLLQGVYPGGYANPAFQWQESLNGSPFTDIAGAQGVNYLRPPTAAPGSYRYRLTMAESENLTSFSCRVASNVITIEVNPLPVVSVTDVFEACDGADVSLSASGGSTYSWTGPNGFSSAAAQPVLEDVDAADEGMYYVLATSDKGCSVRDSGYLFVRPRPTATVSTGADICEGSSTLLQASGGNQYAWTPSTGLSATNIPNPIASPADTTEYMVKVTNNFGCTDSIRTRINVWKKPIANAGPDKTTREGRPVMLEGAAGGTDVSFYWTPTTGLSNPTVLNPNALLQNDLAYTLNVVSDKGCGLSSDQVFVRVFKKVVIPNAFSPNNDGINDTWQIPALQTYIDPEVTVFNRYGQPVYRSKGYGTAWDGSFKGKKLPAGTYYYVIDLKIGEVLSGWVLIVY